MIDHHVIAEISVRVDVYLNTIKSREIPYDRHTTIDRYGRTIEYYLSKKLPDHDPDPWPVILFIQESVSQSLFQRHGDFITGGIQNLLLSEAARKAWVLVQ